MVNANNVITYHEPNNQQAKKNMQSTWGKTSFTSSVILNLDFIIEAQIQAPKAAHTKLSLIKNMHSHVFIYSNLCIGYMATKTFQFKNVAIVKKMLYWLTIQTFSCYALKMYAIYVLNYYTTCAASHNSQR